MFAHTHQSDVGVECDMVTGMAHGLVMLLHTLYMTWHYGIIGTHGIIDEQWIFRQFQSLRVIGTELKNYAWAAKFAKLYEQLTIQKVIRLPGIPSESQTTTI